MSGRKGWLTGLNKSRHGEVMHVSSQGGKNESKTRDAFEVRLTSSKWDSCCERLMGVSAGMQR
jgi:hypothetical protein